MFVSVWRELMSDQAEFLMQLGSEYVSVCCG